MEKAEKCFRVKGIKEPKPSLTVCEALTLLEDTATEDLRGTMRKMVQGLGTTWQSRFPLGRKWDHSIDL